MSKLPDEIELVDVSYEHINLQVYQLLEDLAAAGQISSPRGLKTMEANMCTLDLNPLYTVLNFDDRPFNFRYYAGELAWYLKATSNISFINNFSGFWKNIAPSGEANSNYGTLLFGPHPSTVYSKDADGYPKSPVNQLEWVFDCLANDEHSRQAVAFFNTPYFQYKGNKDFPCTMYVKFWISKGHLEMKVQMRSNDIFYGLTYDAPFFSAIHQSMWMNLRDLVYPDLKLGVYYHSADNIHMYEKHFETADKILDKPLESSIMMRLLHPLFRFEKSTVEFYGTKGTMFINEEATSYLRVVEDLVENEDLPKDQDFWKVVLSSLYEITQAGAINEWKTN